jgi:hypothetical protein
MSIVNRNDRHDLDPTEAKLIRIGHFLWKQYKVATGAAQTALDNALQAVWQAKREYQAELKARREASAQKLREFWASRKAA